jgi:hypothetical protein
LTRAQPWTTPSNYSLSGYSGATTEPVFGQQGEDCRGQLALLFYLLSSGIESRG